MTSWKLGRRSGSARSSSKYYLTQRITGQTSQLRRKNPIHLSLARISNQASIYSDTGQMTTTGPYPIFEGHVSIFLFEFLQGLFPWLLSSQLTQRSAPNALPICCDDIALFTTAFVFRVDVVFVSGRDHPAGVVHPYSLPPHLPRNDSAGSARSPLVRVAFCDLCGQRRRVIIGLEQAKREMGGGEGKVHRSWVFGGWKVGWASSTLARSLSCALATRRLLCPGRGAFGGALSRRGVTRM